MHDVQRREHLPPQRVEAHGHGYRSEHGGGARRRGEQRRHGDERQAALLGEAFGRRPADPQAGEAPGTIGDDDPGEIRRPGAERGQSAVHEIDDFRGLGARAGDGGDALGYRRRTDRDRGDGGRRIDGEPAIAHRSSRFRNWGSASWLSRKYRSSGGIMWPAFSGHSTRSTAFCARMSSRPRSRASLDERNR